MNFSALAGLPELESGFPGWDLKAEAGPEVLDLQAVLYPVVWRMGDVPAFELRGELDLVERWAVGTFSVPVWSGLKMLRDETGEVMVCDGGGCSCCGAQVHAFQAGSWTVAEIFGEDV